MPTTCLTRTVDAYRDAIVAAALARGTPRYGDALANAAGARNAVIAEIERLRKQRDHLLEALRSVLHVLEFEAEARGPNDLLYEIPAGPVLDAARAAIAKAEGRSDG